MTRMITHALPIENGSAPILGWESQSNTNLPTNID